MNEKELRQVQTALKDTEGVNFTRKAPRQLGLFTDFRGGQYRVDFVEGEGWQAKVVFGEGPDLAELQALVPVILKVQQDKEAEAIAQAEAAKAKAEEDRKNAIAQAEAEKNKTEELRVFCRSVVSPDFDRQAWCENQFGYGKWNINELNRQELEILATEIKRRAVEREEKFIEAEKEARAKAEEKARARYGHDCSNYALDENGEILCHGSGPIEYADEVEEEAIADSPCECMDENSSIEESAGEEIEESATSETPFNSSGMDEKSGMDEGEETFHCPGCDRDVPWSEGASDDFPDLCDECAYEEGQKKEAIAPTEITGKALTLKQPWAWAVAHLGKNIENRSWPTKYRGELYIHAGVGWDSEGAKWIAQKFGIEVPSHSELPSGVLVAKCNLSDCRHWTETTGEELPWSNESGFQWFLEAIEAIKPHLPLQGKLGIFTFSVSPDNASKDSPAKALCQTLNLKIEPYGLTTRQHNEDLIEVCLQDECFCWISQETGPWEALEFTGRHQYSDKMKAVKEALKQFLDPDAKAKFDLRNRIHLLSSQMGCEPGGIARKITGKNLSSCSLSELEFIFNRLAQLSQIVGLDNSPIPDKELSEGEKFDNTMTL
ncbi:ASCH domain-containing protein [Laspinema sp. D1]|uniref:ASCH domain-containing protein n=1 Tax=Laspinema palackyanum TaxID=3231601 RepID=UPI003488157D|nr:ASCH domain-containing protein [Laspinema sp. D2b]